MIISESASLSWLLFCVLIACATLCEGPPCPPIKGFLSEENQQFIYMDSELPVPYNNLTSVPFLSVPLPEVFHLSPSDFCSPNQHAIYSSYFLLATCHKV